MKLLILLLGKPILTLGGFAGWTFAYKVSDGAPAFEVEAGAAAGAAIEEVQIVPLQPALREVAPEAQAVPAEDEAPAPKSEEPKDAAPDE